MISILLVLLALLRLFSKCAGPGVEFWFYIAQSRGWGDVSITTVDFLGVFTGGTRSGLCMFVHMKVRVYCHPLLKEPNVFVLQIVLDVLHV